MSFRRDEVADPFGLLTAPSRPQFLHGVEVTTVHATKVHSFFRVTLDLTRTRAPGRADFDGRTMRVTCRLW